MYTEYLSDLKEAGFIEKDRLWSIKSQKYLNLSRYRIKDNYVRFYLKYILPNVDRIANDALADRQISSLPAWDTIMGLQFKNLVLNSRTALYNLLHISPDEILFDNPYYQKKNTTQKGCQIDYLIQSRFNCVYVCEIKFSRNPIGVEVIDEDKAKIAALRMPRNISYRAVLIHVNDVSDSVIAEEFFSNIIDFSQFLNEE